MRCDDGTMNPEGELAAWHKVVGGASEAIGKEFDTESHMRARIEAAGFINVHEKVYKCPIGDWAKDPIVKEAGKFNRIQFKEGAEGVSNYDANGTYGVLTGVVCDFLANQARAAATLECG